MMMVSMSGCETLKKLISREIQRIEERHDPKGEIQPPVIEQMPESASGTEIIEEESAPAPVEVPVIEVEIEEYQSDPNVFGVSKLPLGVDKVVAAGLLNPEQLESIKLSNIAKIVYFKNSVYDKELIHMLQRFIVDGYLRGVNVIPIIKAQNNKLVLQVKQLSGARGMASGETVTLSTSFWKDAPFYSRLRTFYHELGHAIFERAHQCGYTLMWSSEICSGARLYPRGDKYDVMLDEMYSFKNWKLKGPLEGGAKKNCPISGCV